MNQSFSPRSTRGSALAVALLFTMVCALLAFSVLQWSGTERRLNARGALWLGARNATEGVAEYGFSQMRNDFETKSTPGIYKPGTANALNLPDPSVFAGTRVITGALSNSNPHGMELIAGPVTQINNGAVYFVDPNDYNNQFDPLKGKWVFRQDVVVIARASVQPPSGAPITHYVTETISIRGAPLYAHAIFYAGDLEIAPGPQMDIYGPVHTNGSMFISSQGNAGGLNFHGPVTAAGAIFHAWKSSTASAQGSGSEALGQTPVTFVNASGTQVNMNAGTTSSPVWKDSTMGADSGVSGGVPANPTATPATAATGLFALLTSTVNSSFRQYAKSTWGGNVMTGTCGILPYNPVSFNQVIDAAGDHPDPSVLIDPPNTPATSDTYYSPKMEVEAQKRSVQAGLYIKVTVSTAGTATLNIYGPTNSAPVGTLPALIGPNGGLLLNNPLNVANAPSSATPPLVAYLPYRRKSVVNTGSGTNGHTITTTIYDAAGNVVGTPTVQTGQNGTNGTVTTINTDAWTGSFGYGLYDQRRGLSTSGTNVDGATDLVQIDMRALTALVNSMKTNTNDANAITYTDPTTSTIKVWNNENAVASGLISATQPVGAEKTPWNGAVYIDVQAPNSGTSHQTASVRLVNGTVANGSSLIPSYGVNGIGLSLATNAPLYILGHFNADGVLTASSSTTPDDGQDGSAGHTSKESPTSLAADCITILSPGWSDANSLTLKPNVSGDVEIAAAFLVGIVPTATASSGGAHNLPRFLENWSGHTVSMRGSMVTMFNCRIATQPWSTSYYGAPARDWGFDSLFKNGVYPPFTPKVMSYRRVDFTDLTADQYATLKASLWP